MTAFDGVLVGAIIACLICAIQIFPNDADAKKRSSFITALCVLVIAILIICIAAFKFQWDSEILDIPSDETTAPETPETAKPETIAPSTQETTIPEIRLIPNDVRIGDTFTFGTYEQDNITAEAEKIEWLVLAKDENRILVLSKYGLDSERYNKTYKTVTWATSNIRTWLNDGFYNDAFTAEEQELILLSRIEPGDSPDKDCDSGTGTEDHVFLLSWEEMKTYIQENALIDTSNTLLCRPTEYAVKEKGAYKNEKGYGWWWLRTSVINNCYAASVNSDASIDLKNGKVNSPNAVIRPAMWVIVE